jgi:hypothetical protein
MGCELMHENRTRDVQLGAIETPQTHPLVIIDVRISNADVASLAPITMEYSLADVKRERVDFPIMISHLCSRTRPRTILAWLM